MVTSAVKQAMTGDRSRQLLRPAQHGFTLVELIVVIVLLGIVSVVVVARFLNPNAFNQQAATDALVSNIRFAQQASLGRSDVSFTIEQQSGEWIFTALADTDVLSELAVSTGNVRLETGEPVWTGDTCASGSSFNVPVDNFELVFDSQGNLASFSNTTVGTEPMAPTFNGVRICVNDTVSASVCVSRAGYAHVGNCDE